jgi:hypothetical protein
MPIVLDGPMWHLCLYLIWWPPILLCTVVSGISIKFEKKSCPLLATCTP